MLLVWIILALLASLLVLLCVPVDLIFAVRRTAGRQEVTGVIGWLFGLVPLRLGKQMAQEQAKPGRPRVKHPPRKRGGAGRIMAMLGNEGFARRLIKLAEKLLRRIHIRDLSLEVRLGLDDPADTGRLWAVVGPLAAILALPSVTRVAIEPDFSAEILEIDGNAHIRIIPLQLLFVILVFILSPRTLRALYTM